MRLSAGLSVAVAALAACAGSAEAPRAAIRDSAGITIVESVEPAWRDGEGWVINSLPSVVIGELNGAPEEEFGRIASARRLADGRIVVADGDRRQPQVVVFASDGRFVGRLGQVGEGPGDFRRIGGVFALGNNAAVWDYVLRRLTVFDADGRPIETRQVDRPPCAARACATLQPTGVFADGTVIGGVGRVHIDPPEGVRTDSTWLTVAGLDGTLSVIDSVYWRTGWQKNFPDGSLVFNDEPFGASGALAIGSAGYAYSDGATYEVRSFAPDGSLRRIVRVLREVPPMTVDARRWFWEREVADESPEVAARSDEIYSWLPWPERMPAYDALQLDDTGNLWARVVSKESGLAEWEVFDPDGQWLGTVKIPRHLEVQQITRDGVLAIMKGALDESMVVVHRVFRGGSQPSDLPSERILNPEP